MTSTELRYDGRVAIVTGAGGGLGRAYALAFASRGASVVVNDLGGDMRGDGSRSSAAADKVVEEIKNAGGKAVANYDSVEDGEKIVQTALDAFGRVDIVINNAGILRDRSVPRTSDADWDLIQRVHLRGSFMVSRAAWPHMKKQKYGRIIMTTSIAGLYGNFGQANYSAAKAGLVGLAFTLAVEGAKDGIQCNAIAPSAGSRMTETVMPPALVEALKPEYIAPLVLYLSHESCEETHSVFEVCAGWVAKTRWQRSQGVLLRDKTHSITPESVRDNWAEIADFTRENTYANSLQEAGGNMMDILSESQKDHSLQHKKTAGKIDVAKARQHRFAPLSYTVTPRDVQLYAVSVGAEPSRDLRFLYEGHEDFAALPSFAVIPAQASLAQLLGGIEGLSFNPMMLLHGEQHVQLLQPIPTDGVLVSQATLVDILDKGKGAVIVMDVVTKNASGEVVFINQFTSFVRGIGGFGGPSSSPNAKEAVPIPSGKADVIASDKTTTNQAALYRINGDSNPLHIAPDMAAIGGFDRPILHGLCSFGFACRQVLACVANSDPTRVKAIKTRFSAPVFPGETLETSMWIRGNRVHFQTRVVERNVIVLNNSYIDLTQVTIQPYQSLCLKPTAGSSLKSAAVFAELAKNLNADIVKNVGAIYQWNITQNGAVAGQWSVDLKNGAGSVTEGPAKPKADCSLTLADDDLISLFNGSLDPMKAFMGGKLKIGGNVMLSQKLKALFEANKSKVSGAAKTVAAAPAAPAAAPKTSLKAEKLFADMQTLLTKDVVAKVATVFQWNITGADGKIAGQWTTDLKTGEGSIYSGPAKTKAECTLTLGDDTFEGLVNNTLDPMKAFMSGKLKIAGNVMLAQKLQSLFNPPSKL